MITEKQLNCLCRGAL